MNKVAIITGGLNKIKASGFYTAINLLKNGYSVTIADINCDESNFEELNNYGEVLYVKTDVSTESDCQNAVNKTLEKFGRVDVLVNLAAVVGRKGLFTELDIEDIKKTIDVDLMGTIYMSRFVAREMIKQKSGVIVNVGSICGCIANGESIGYHASKGAVRMITSSMARELSPYGIRVVSIAPGWIMRDESKFDRLEDSHGASFHMKGRIISPKEVANAIYLMTLPEASAINGTTVMADDGYSAFKGLV